MVLWSRPRHTRVGTRCSESKERTFHPYQSRWTVVVTSLFYSIVTDRTLSTSYLGGNKRPGPRTGILPCHSWVTCLFLSSYLVTTKRLPWYLV